MSEKQHFVQHELIQAQLPRYIDRLNSVDATVEAVWRSAGPPGSLSGFRFSVAYWHTEEVTTEIYC